MSNRDNYVSMISNLGQILTIASKDVSTSLRVVLRHHERGMSKTTLEKVFGSGPKGYRWVALVHQEFEFKEIP